MMQLGGPRAEARQGRIPTSAGPMPSYRGKFDVCQDSHGDSLSSTSEMGEHPGSPSVLRFCFHFFFLFSPTAALCSLQLGGSLTTSPPVCLRPSNRPSCGLCQLIPPPPKSRRAGAWYQLKLTPICSGIPIQTPSVPVVANRRVKPWQPPTHHHRFAAAQDAGCRCGTSTKAPTAAAHARMHAPNRHPASTVTTARGDVRSGRTPTLLENPSISIRRCAADLARIDQQLFSLATASFPLRLCPAFSTHYPSFLIPTAHSHPRHHSLARQINSKPRSRRSPSRILASPFGP
ncbi:uncharacterized protein J3D65DRAFT_22731 [Phyllosticta citribraziliensis]|uniref:Uncharacterized protein n=1 Tax=Phyllosticta citribraziliensis TaxID=989973 RepID=A0ABR1M9G6_9PEZI